MLADVYYYDDLARTYYGAGGWNGDGRPLAEQLIKLLCGGLPITDLGAIAIDYGYSIPDIFNYNLYKGKSEFVFR